MVDIVPWPTKEQHDDPRWRGVCAYQATRALDDLVAEEGVSPQAAAQAAEAGPEQVLALVSGRQVEDPLTRRMVTIAPKTT